jgi:hypothetical protein
MANHPKCLLTLLVAQLPSCCPSILETPSAGLGAMARTIIPATQQVVRGRTVVLGQPRQNVSVSLSQQISGDVVTRACMHKEGIGRRTVI